MIRLIATDIDGTLVEEGTIDINPEYYDVIKELRNRVHQQQHSSNIGMMKEFMHRLLQRFKRRKNKKKQSMSFQKREIKFILAKRV